MKTYKTFFIKLAVFAVFVVIVDFCFGLCMNYLNSHVQEGRMAKRYHVCKESTEDILLFGTSRMSRHYIPQIIEDSLGMTCYNCGEDGNGIVLSYGYLKMVLGRYTPKMVVYDLSDLDLYQSNDDNNKKYISYLKPYCNEPGIMDVITAVSDKEKVKLKSNLYRYNSIVLELVGSIFGVGIMDEKGYIPYKKVMEHEPELHIDSAPKVDSLKLSMLHEFIKTCSDYDVQLVFVLSPRYKGSEYGVLYPEIRDLCNQYDIPFWDHTADSAISETKTMFANWMHLNDVGAEAYTRELIPSLKEVLAVKDEDSQSLLVQKHTM